MKHLCQIWQRKSRCFNSNSGLLEYGVIVRSGLRPCAYMDPASPPTFCLIVFERETHPTFVKQGAEDKRAKYNFHVRISCRIT